MALVSLKGGVLWPDALSMSVLGSSFVTSNANMQAGKQINAAGAKFAFVFICPPGGLVVHTVKFQVPVKTTNGNCDVRVETVSATDGNPTGTLAATNTNATAAISATGLQTVTLTADATLSAGTFYAIVFARSTGDYQIGAFQTSNQSSGINSGQLSPYTRYNSGGGYASRTNADSWAWTPICALLDASSNTQLVPGFAPISAVAKTAFNNTSATRERGASLIPRVPMRVIGWYVVGQLFNGDCDVVLATTDGTARLTFTGDKDWGSAYVTGTSYGVFQRGYFSSTYDLAAGTTYYLTLKPSSATDANLLDVTIIDTSDAGGFAGFAAGTDCKLVTRDSGGTYTISSTQRPFSLGLIVSHLDDGAGGGGGLASPVVHGILAA